MYRYLTVALFLAIALSVPGFAQTSPYFVAYDHTMEEPGNLEINHKSMIGWQRENLPTYWAPLVEFEYGVTGWWSSSIYLEAASQSHDATVFTGFRLENRLKPLKQEHKINPILYVEFEDVNEASRIKNEVVGHAELSDEPLSALRAEKAREVEGKLILSSNAKGWNFAENFILEKNMTEDEGVEFGYALGISRPLASMASGNKCRLCRENFNVGLELYGGLGSTEAFGLSNTAHYLAPTVAWRFSQDQVLRVSPNFGLTGNSDRVLLRIGYTYEIEGFGSQVARMFRRK